MPTKSKFPRSGPKTMEVDIAWLEPEESKRPKRSKSRDGMAAVATRKGPPPMPGSSKKGPPPMPVEPMPTGPKTMEVKAEWLDPPSQDGTRRRSRASMAPVTAGVESEPKSRRSRASIAATRPAEKKAGPPIPRED